MHTSQGDTPDNNFIVESYIEVKEYQINKDDIIYNILLGKKNNSVIIRTLLYFYELHLNDSKVKFNTINELFNFYNDLFEQNKVKIYSINKDNKEMVLYFSLEEEPSTLCLKYYEQNTSHIINYLWNKNIKLIKDLKKANEQINQIKDEYESLRNRNKELNDENNKIKEENQDLKKEINQIKEELNNLNQGNSILKQDIKNIMENFNKITEEINSIKNKKESNINNNNVNNFSQNNFSVLIRDDDWIPKITPLNNCSSTDKVSELMERYKKAINDNNLNNFYFIYNAKRLEEKSTLAEAGIRNGNIFTFEVGRRKGV